MGSRDKNKGFTLVELMISVAIASVVTGAIYMAYRSQQESFVAQEQVGTIQQNLRAGMLVMTKETRMAGYNPDGVIPAPTITAAANDSITFQRDDGTGTGTNDAYIYSLDIANSALDRDFNGGGGQMVCENIDALGFAYAYDDDGDGELDKWGGSVIWAIDSDDDGDLDLNLDTDSNGIIDINDNPAGTAINPNVALTSIRSVKLWILGRAGREDDHFSNNNTYVLSDQRVTPNDTFRRRLFTTTVRCKNMGL